MTLARGHPGLKKHKVKVHPEFRAEDGRPARPSAPQFASVTGAPPVATKVSGGPGPHGPVHRRWEES